LSQLGRKAKNVYQKSEDGKIIIFSVFVPMGEQMMILIWFLSLENTRMKSQDLWKKDARE
jgi:hypothetical protein